MFIIETALWYKLDDMECDTFVHTLPVAAKLTDDKIGISEGI
jgi:hypothetical protein